MPKGHSRSLGAAALLAVLALSLPSCRTVPNESPPPIPVPEELSDSDVELAILLAVADGPVPKLTPGQQITDEALRAILGSYEGVRNRKWFFEDRDPGVVFVGFQHRAFYMRVAVHYTRDAVTLSIVDSRNLSQRWGRIHKRAHAWLGQLESRIRQGLGEVVKRNLYGSARDLSERSVPKGS